MKGVRGVKINIECEAKEISALVLALQERIEQKSQEKSDVYAKFGATSTENSDTYSITRTFP